jgi:hypothetical protein
MVEQIDSSEHSPQTETSRKRIFTLRYDFGTYFQADRNLAHETVRIEAVTQEEAALRGMRQLFREEFRSDWTRFNPSTPSLNIAENQDDEDAAKWVSPYDLVPNWQDVVQFRTTGSRLGLEPREDFERRLVEFLDNLPQHQ